MHEVDKVILQNLLKNSSEFIENLEEKHHLYLFSLRRPLFYTLTCKHYGYCGNP